MRKRTVMFLGAANFQLPPIEYAIAKGYRTITCDNRIENPGHKIADKSYIISTTDKEKLLEVAINEKIDAVLTFGSDVSAPSAAYISEQLNLPGNCTSAINILTNKALFREFLNKNALQKTNFRSFHEKDKDKVEDYIKSISLPIVIKPVDSSGSKGVFIIKNTDNTKGKIETAFNESISKTIIVEDYVAKIGKQVCGDGFMERGKLKFIYFGDGHFYHDTGYNAPWGETFPSTHNIDVLEKAKAKIENILVGAGFFQGPFNHDIFILDNNECFVNELGPRSGGNYIPQAIYLKTGYDMIEGAVEIALDFNYKLTQKHPEDEAFYSCYMIHSKSDSGVLKKIGLSEVIMEKVVTFKPYINPGEEVSPFTKGNLAVGNVILKFDTFHEMNSLYNNNIHSLFNILFNE